MSPTRSSAQPLLPVPNRREADKVEVPPIPTGPDGGAWLRETERKVVAAAASSKPKDILAWLKPCRDHQDDPEEVLGFDRCPEALQTLDAKVGVAVAEAVRKCKMQGLRLKIDALDEDASKADTLLGGRRVIYEVARRLEIHDGQGLQRAATDLLKLKIPKKTQTRKLRHG